MAEFHFVEDYEKLVLDLIEKHPLEEAMQIAVGGNYDHFGTVELNILRHAGLKTHDSLLDMGCGSGRLAHAIGESGLPVEYTGFDIIQNLLDYAATRSPPSYKFLLHRQLNVPVADAILDMACGFSLFTHLLHPEIYLYMEDVFRALRPGGKLVFSFLEFASPHHWETFRITVNDARARTTPHLNTFIERPVIALWAAKLGYQLDFFIEPDMGVSGSHALGQTTAVLTKP
jgi:SAM-dependent methyltransferase